MHRLVLTLYQIMQRTNNITCPSCEHEFNVEEVIAKKVELGFDAQMKERKDALQIEFQKKLETLTSREKKLSMSEKEQNELIDARLKEKEQVLIKHLNQKLEGDYDAKFKSLEQDAKTKAEQLNAAKLRETLLLKRERELNEAKENLDLDFQKRLLEEREIIKSQMDGVYQKKKALEMQEKNILINQLKERIDDMKKKTDQGSMQVQGEAQELVLENLLAQKFPYDNISEVAKGASGADCVQIIRNELGAECGSIVFESKRTKSFSNGWIAKLKQDTLRVKGNISVLVSEALPEGLKGFGQLEGVWVVDFTHLENLVTVLRFAVLKEHQALDSQVNKGEKMQMLYDYLTGSEFGMQMQTIIEGFTSMKGNLEREKRSMQASWKRQDKELDKVIESTVHMYGSVRGIAGSAVKEIKQLEIEE